MRNPQDFVGTGNFVWWLGRVVDRSDPESLGRVRVRCLGWHSDDNALVPYDTLPWAHVIYAPSSTPAITPPRIGDWVMGYFADGNEAQQPYVLGVLPTKGVGGFAEDLADDGPEPLASRPNEGIETTPEEGGTVKTPTPAVPRTAAGTPAAATGGGTPGGANATATQATGLPDGAGGTFDEPGISDAAVYPYNQATVTESGHSLELDDSPGAERVALRHATGSGVEVQPDGTKIDKSVQDNYLMISGASFESVGAGKTVAIAQGLNLQTSGGAGIIAKVDGGGGIDITVTGGNVKINVTGDVELTNTGKTSVNTTGDIAVTTAANMSLTAAANLTATAGATLTLAAPAIVIG
jgi:hypothetical protein